MVLNNLEEKISKAFLHFMNEETAFTLAHKLISAFGNYKLSIRCNVINPDLLKITKIIY